MTASGLFVTPWILPAGVAALTPLVVGSIVFRARITWLLVVLNYLSHSGADRSGRELQPLNLPPGALPALL